MCELSFKFIKAIAGEDFFYLYVFFNLIVFCLHLCVLVPLGLEL